MKRAIAGISYGDETTSMLRFLGRLHPAHTEVELLHVIERFGTPVLAEPPQFSNDLIERFVRMQEQAGRDTLAQAAKVLEAYQLKTHQELRTGFIANEILAALHEKKGDLVAIGSRDERPLGKLLIGSVGRKLVNKVDKNLLVVRGDIAETGPIRAVFATDHSPYAMQCIDSLLTLAPQGLKEVTVMTAYSDSLLTTMGTLQTHITGDLNAWVEEKLQAQNQKVAARLSALPCETRSLVLCDDPAEAIERAMVEAGANLLILGAQGHGFLERLTLGSISFKQVVEGKYSVLVLRAAGAES